MSEKPTYEELRQRVTVLESAKKNDDHDLQRIKFCHDHAPLAVYQVGMDAKILNVNNQACHNLGYTHQELCNLSIFDIDPAFPREKWPEHVRTLGLCGSRTIQSVHQRKDGTTFPVEVSIKVGEHQGDVFHFSYVKDLTEQLNAEREKVKLENQFRHAQKMEAVGTFAGGIAHDFSNILTAVIGYAELAKIETSGNSSAQKYLDQICETGSRAKNITNQILTFSRRSPTEKKPSDLCIIIKDVLNLIRVMLPSTIEIHDDVRPDMGAIFADQPRLHQVVMNLCMNAYQAMKEEGGYLEVKLVPAAITSANAASFPEMTPGLYLKLSVSDNGCGMDEETMSQAFEPYFTTKEAGEGTGLGLSTVHGIVKDHGGDIKVDSEKGVGTTFQIFFPIADDPSGENPHNNLKISHRYPYACRATH